MRAPVCTALKVADVLYFDDPTGRVKIQKTSKKYTAILYIETHNKRY